MEIRGRFEEKLRTAMKKIKTAIACSEYTEDKKSEQGWQRGARKGSPAEAC